MHPPYPRELITSRPEPSSNSHNRASDFRRRHPPTMAALRLAVLIAKGTGRGAPEYRCLPNRVRERRDMRSRLSRACLVENRHQPVANDDGLCRDDGSAPVILGYDADFGLRAIRNRA